MTFLVRFVIALFLMAASAPAFAHATDIAVAMADQTELTFSATAQTPDQSSEHHHGTSAHCCQAMCGPSAYLAGLSETGPFAEARETIVALNDRLSGHSTEPDRRPPKT